MDFKKNEISHCLGTTTMGQAAIQFSDALEVALKEAAPDAVGLVRCEALHGPDSIMITIINAPIGSRNGVDWFNNRAMFKVEKIDSPKLKLERGGFYHCKSDTRISMRGKSARSELVIKAIVKFFCDISETEPSLQKHYC